ncbi:MAG: hypothetical protein AAFR12_05330 [Cyanobacteria bacterium J06626_6]
MHDLRNWSAFLVLYAGLASCSADEIDSFFASVDGSIGQQPVTASEPLNFNPGMTFPHRDHGYDGYSSPTGLQQWQLNKLFNHIAMPQSEKAMSSVLGHWDHADGDWYYWAIDGGSSELAVKIVDGYAQTYTVGY